MRIASHSFNKAVPFLDKEKFSGKWYVLYSIPTFFDKNWRQTIEHYSLDIEGFFHVVTSYKTTSDDEIKSVRSKLFPDEKGSGEMKAQFLWPFKSDYQVIELADDYSYALIGHPNYKYLYILSRLPYISPALLEGIKLRCREHGYPISELISQEHH